MYKLMKVAFERLWANSVPHAFIIIIIIHDKV
jgi:hypothetical protein